MVDIPDRLKGAVSTLQDLGSIIDEAPGEVVVDIRGSEVTLNKGLAMLLADFGRGRKSPFKAFEYSTFEDSSPDREMLGEWARTLAKWGFLQGDATYMPTAEAKNATYQWKTY